MQTSHRFPSSSGDAVRLAKRYLATGLGLALLLSLFVDIAVMVVPIYDMQLYDRVIQSHNMNTLAMLSVACMAGLLLYGVVDYLRSAVFVIIADRIARRLHVPVLQAAVRSRGAGDASASADALRDLNDLRVFIASGAAATPLDAVCAPLLLGVMFMIHPVYGFLGLSGIAMLLLFGLATEWRGRPAVVAATQQRTALAGALSSRLRESAVTEGLGMLPAIARRWSHEQASGLAELRLATQRADVLTVSAQVCRLLLQACLMSMGVLMILSHATTPGSLMGANMLLAKVLQPYDHLVDSWRHWSLAQASWTRMSTLLRGSDRLAENAAASDAEAITGVLPGLEVRDVHLRKGGRLLLDGISFALPSGSALGVVGPNGCGKSTLLRLLAGVSSPDGGGISLDGVPCRQQGALIGYLPQSVGLLDGTIADNVMRFRQQGLETTREAIDACRQAGVHDLVSRMRRGYETPVGQGSTSLSGGQHQRIGLARALFGTPRLLILDEPDASIDNDGEEALLNVLAAAKDQGAAVVVVSHRPRLLAAMDFHMKLEGGRMVSFEAIPHRSSQSGQASGSKSSGAAIRIVQQTRSITA